MATRGKRSVTGAINVAHWGKEMKNFLEWQIATVKSIHPETPEVKTFTLQLPDWTPHRPGQHYDIRLTAPDGYQAQRSYSIASEPERHGEIDLTVERIEDGEVSSYLDEVVVPGDQLEVRGPIGGYFVWEASLGGPLLLIAGGSGVVPLMAVLRHHARVGSSIPARLLYSARSEKDIIYKDELSQLSAKSYGLARIYYTLTRSQPQGWTGYTRRIDRQILVDILGTLEGTPKTYICGPTLMVESASNLLVELGFDPNSIKTERFGPTGSVAQEVRTNANARV